MEISNIVKELTAHIKSGIENVLSGSLTEFEFSNMSLSDSLDILNELGLTDEAELETNGWQWDYWQSFDFKDKRYLLSGSGFYGDSKFQIITNE